MTMPIKQKYLDILKIEINDLTDDIGLLVEEYRKRKQKDEITNYVFLENLAVLHNEMQGVDNLVQILDEIDPNTYTSLEDMIVDVKKRVRERIRKSDLAGALYILVSRKIDKVATFVHHVQD